MFQFNVSRPVSVRFSVFALVRRFENNNKRCYARVFPEEDSHRLVWES
jgi:hypothetical protein